MSSAHQLAIALLPHLEKNALRGKEWVRSYGFYCESIELNPATHGKAIGMAMHVIGAACILARIPVVPLHYVERADKEWKGVFESEYLEQHYVLPHWNLLVVSAREHAYTVANFTSIRKALEVVIPKHLAHLATPRKLWRFIVQHEVRPGENWIKRALPEYQKIIYEARARG